MRRQGSMPGKSCRVPVSLLWHTFKRGSCFAVRPCSLRYNKMNPSRAFTGPGTNASLFLLHRVKNDKKRSSQTACMRLPLARYCFGLVCFYCKKWLIDCPTLCVPSDLHVSKGGGNGLMCILCISQTRPTRALLVGGRGEGSQSEI